MPWFNPWFWLAGITFSLFTGIVAGSYPALYLSSFQPLKVLKGNLRAGRFAAVPRKVLVIVQFKVSVSLIIGTVVVFRQIQFAKNRPVGYNKSGLMEVRIDSPELFRRYAALRNDLRNSGAVVDMAESSGSVTAQDGGTTNFSWPGKNPSWRFGGRSLANALHRFSNPGHYFLPDCDARCPLVYERMA